MARFLCTTWSFPGHIYPTMSVASALRARGHDVAIYTGPRASAQVTGLGYTYFPMHHVDEDALYRLMFPARDAGTRISSLAGFRHLRTALRGWLLDTIPSQLRDLEPIVDSWQPDVILCDYTLWAPYLVIHETRSVPVAIFSLATGCMLSGPDAPVWGRALPPPTTPTRRLRNLLERGVVKVVNREFPRLASAVRVEHGLAPLTGSAIDFGASMPLYLVTSVPELDYHRRDLPPCVHYVGRCSWSQPAADLPEWLQRKAPERPLIYVTEGTVTRGRPGLLQAAARGLAGLPVEVLLKDAQAVDAQGDPAARGLADLAANIRLEGFTPGQGDGILARSDVVITNGGAGSVLAALAAGVPLIVAPTEWDKPENARRVVEAGAGIWLPARKLAPEGVRAAVRHLLSEPAYRENARRIAASLARVGPERAADLLETLCGGAAERAPRALVMQSS